MNICGTGGTNLQHCLKKSTKSTVKTYIVFTDGIVDQSKNQDTIRSNLLSIRENLNSTDNLKLKM